MTEIFLKWALGFNGVIILSLIGVIWRMLGTRLSRIEASLQKEIDRQEVEIKDLRVRKHDNIEAMQHMSGRVHALEEDVQNVRRKSYLVEQLLQHGKSND